MKRRLVLGTVCMVMVAATAALSGCPTTGDGWPGTPNVDWPMLVVGKTYTFRSSGDQSKAATVVSQKGQWVTATTSFGETLFVNLDNVFDIRD